jgi:probable HAF family extracellular repeat protein
MRVLILLLLSAGVAAAGEFRQIPLDAAYDVTSDGSVVVGRDLVCPAIWNRGDEASTLLPLSGACGPDMVEATVISRDGSLIAGARAWSAGPVLPGYNLLIWNGVDDLNPGEPFPGEGRPTAISADGRTLAGAISARNNQGNTGRSMEHRAWTTAPPTAISIENPHSASYITGNSYYGAANGVSADGAVIVGETQTYYPETVWPFYPYKYQYREAFMWTEAGGMKNLGDLPGGEIDARAQAVSDDGRIVAGQSSSAVGKESFIWTEQSGMIALGDLPGGIFESKPVDISADGRVILGNGSTDQGQTPYLWDAEHGLRSLPEVFADQGIAFTESFAEMWANGMSAEGRFIVGGARVTPTSVPISWFAEIKPVPEPATWLLAMFAAVGGGLLRRRG